MAYNRVKIHVKYGNYSLIEKLVITIGYMSKEKVKEVTN